MTSSIGQNNEMSTLAANRENEKGEKKSHCSLYSRSSKPKMAAEFNARTNVTFQNVLKENKCLA